MLVASVIFTGASSGAVVVKRRAHSSDELAYWTQLTTTWPALFAATAAPDAQPVSKLSTRAAVPQAPPVYRTIQMLFWAFVVRSSTCSQATTTSPGPVTAREGLWLAAASVATFSTCGALQVPFAARTLPPSVMWLSGGTFSVQTTPAMPLSFMAMTAWYRLPLVVMAVGVDQWTPSADVLCQMPCDVVS